MIVVIQRCSKATVLIKNKVFSKIDNGLMILLGIKKGDQFSDADKIIDKVINMRIFNDKNNKMNLSAMDKESDIMVVSQFTLYGNIKKGRRPSFIDAENPDIAEKLYNYFIDKIKAKGFFVRTGKFGQTMSIDFINDGPVTFILDSKDI